MALRLSKEIRTLRRGMKVRFGLSVLVREIHVFNAVRDPTKDQSIVFLYLVCVLALLLWALINSRLGQLFIERARTTVRARMHS